MPPNKILQPNFASSENQSNTILTQTISQILGFNILRPTEFSYEGEQKGEGGKHTKTFVVNLGNFERPAENDYLNLEVSLNSRLEGKLTGAAIFIETAIIKQIRTIQVLKEFLFKFDTNDLVLHFYDPSTKKIRFGLLLNELKNYGFPITIQDLVDLIPYGFSSQHDANMFFNGLIGNEVYVPITLEYTPNQNPSQVKILIDKANQLQSVGLNPESIIINPELQHAKVKVIIPVSKTRLISMIAGLRVNFFEIQKNGSLIQFNGKEYQDTIFAGIISSLYILHSKGLSNGNLYNSLAVHITRPGSPNPLDSLIQFGDTSELTTDGDNEAHVDFMKNLFQDLEDLIAIIKAIKNNRNILPEEVINAQSMLNHYLDLIEAMYGSQIKFIKARISNIFQDNPID